MAHKLPHGFENREQYENTIRTPIGKEWQTTVSFQTMTRPKVIVEAGQVINPLKFSK